MKATVPLSSISSNISSGSPTAEAVTPPKIKQRLSKSIKMVLAVALTVASPVRLILVILMEKRHIYPKYFQSITKRLALCNNLGSRCAAKDFRNNPRIVADISESRRHNETGIHRHFTSLLPLPFPDILRRERTGCLSRYWLQPTCTRGKPRT